MAGKLSVLIVEDDPQLNRILQAVLKQVDADLRIAGTGRLALQMIQDAPPSILLLDMRLPDMLGMEILKEVRSRGIPVTVIVMTAHGSVDLAVGAMREGAYDFLTKPLDFERVRVMVRNAIERHRIIEQLDDFRSLYERTKFRGLVGSSPAMQRLYRQIRSVGGGLAPVLLLGEPGTELQAVARALHDEGPRASGPYVVLESTPTPEAAAVTEALRAADGGTLFVAAVEKLSQEGAAALLRYLQTGAVEGGNEPMARVLAAAEGEDAAKADPALLRALEVNRILLPRLRERSDDVLDIADQALSAASKELGRSFAALSDEVQVAFVTYPWPGNREELERTVRTIVQKNEGRTITLEMLPAPIAATVAQAKATRGEAPRGLETSQTVRPLWEVEREEILKALTLCEGNVLQAARLLQVSPATIYRKQQTWKSLAS